MNIKKILTPKQLEVCQKEQYYFQQIGIKKHLLDIALSHHFIQKKESSKAYNLELMKEFEMIIAEERDDVLKILRKELLGEKRLAELSAKVHKKVEQKKYPRTRISAKIYGSSARRSRDHRTQNQTVQRHGLRRRRSHRHL